MSLARPAIRETTPSFFSRLTTSTESEKKIFFVPILSSAGVATLFALPSMGSAIYEHSNFPSYVLKGICFGAILGFVSLVYQRLKATQEIIADGDQEVAAEGYASVVCIRGEIKNNTADKILPLLKKAFEDKKSKGVIIKMNSRGGSPVQASILHQEILKLKARYAKKVVVLGEDILASAAYLIAASADKIYADVNTLTGSIGVICTSYGLHELAQKVGVELRVFASGKHKNRLDAFKPVDEEDKAKMLTIAADMHQHFIQAVKASRKDKLKTDDDVLFSGDVWTGSQSLELGLIDELGTLTDILVKEFKVTKFEEAKNDSWFDIDLSSALQKSIQTSITAAIEEESSLRFQM
jgi:protease-4